MARDYQQFSPLAAMSYVQQQGDIGRERGQRNQLNQLASLAYSAPAEQRDSILSQAASVDAGAAQGIEKQMAYSDERRNTNMVNMAKLLTGAPPEARAGLYRSMVPTLARFGMSELPQEYTPETAPIIDKAAQSLVQAYQGVNSTPTDVRSFQMMTAGLSPEQVSDARLVNLGLKGRASNAGYGFFEFEGADGRKRMGRNNPRNGAREVYDEASGDFVPLGGMQAGAAGTTGNPLSQGGSQAMVDQSAELANQLIAAGIPEAQVDAFLMQRLNPGGAQPMASRASPQLAVGRAPEDQAAATERAKLQAQQDFLPTELGMRTQADIEKARGTEMAKTEAERVAQAPKRIKQYEQALDSSKNVTQSIDKALGMLGAMSTGFVGARSRGIEGSPAYNLASEIETVKANLGFDRLQQMRDNSPTGGALGAIAVQELVALQSTIANLDPNQGEEQIRANLERVKEHYQRWQAAVQNALAEEKSAPQQATQRQAAPDRPQSNAIPQRARNPQTGQVIELRNGQWVPVQ